MATKLMGAMNISDPAFDRVITLRDAYRAMERVVVEHVGRGEMSTIDFLSYVGITETGYSGDPAAFEDFLRAVDQVSEGPSGV